jgi:hypothetical protein
MIPAVGGKYGGPVMTHSYLEAMESFLPDAGIEMYYYDQLGCGTPADRGSGANNFSGQKRSWRRVDLRRKDSVPDSERSLVFEA